MVTQTVSRIDIEALAFKSSDSMVLEAIQKKYPWFSELDLIEAISVDGAGLSQVLEFLEAQSSIWKEY